MSDDTRCLLAGRLVELPSVDERLVGTRLSGSRRIVAARDLGSLLDIGGVCWTLGEFIGHWESSLDIGFSMKR
jgi:hypothetical protein